MFRTIPPTLLRAVPLALALATASPAKAANVSIYGHIDIGGLPQPPVLIVPTPVIITPPRVMVEREPVYLHVPPGHRKNWRKHCGRYNACGERVYFVQDEWYERVYVPERARHGHPPHHHDRGYEVEYREHRTIKAPPPPRAPEPPRHGGGPGHDKGHGDHGKHKGH
ncbi:hypothetical protein VVD49_05565 [Uliginosibacterium sp. H3]|uniref:Lipoprotein n=1 Tax=Uliginosibacterium silvisoli TaxID=3114758 RepID=A0ABU6K149_9RHOO|nr:hypothetical protein [Uliginosibacterium sp. H3]